LDRHFDSKICKLGCAASKHRAAAAKFFRKPVQAPTQPGM
jgi:hypothetical protein